MGGEYSAGLEVDLTALQCKGFKGMFTTTDSSSLLLLQLWEHQEAIIHPDPHGTVTLII